jgi:hypothetical protein
VARSDALIVLLTLGLRMRLSKKCLDSCPRRDLQLELQGTPRVRMVLTRCLPLQRCMFLQRSQTLLCLKINITDTRTT